MLMQLSSSSLLTIWLFVCLINCSYHWSDVPNRTWAVCLSGFSSKKASYIAVRTPLGKLQLNDGWTRLLKLSVPSSAFTGDRLCWHKSRTSWMDTGLILLMLLGTANSPNRSIYPFRGSCATEPATILEQSIRVSFWSSHCYPMLFDFWWLTLLLLFDCLISVIKVMAEIAQNGSKRTASHIRSSSHSQQYGQRSD